MTAKETLSEIVNARVIDVDSDDNSDSTATITATATKTWRERDMDCDSASGDLKQIITAKTTRKLPNKAL